MNLSQLVSTMHNICKIRDSNPKKKKRLKIIIRMSHQPNNISIKYTLQVHDMQLLNNYRAKLMNQPSRTAYSLSSTHLFNELNFQFKLNKIIVIVNPMFKINV